MKVKGKHYRAVWVHPENNEIIQIIDQRHLPHKFVIEDLRTVDDFYHAIKDEISISTPILPVYPTASSQLLSGYHPLLRMHQPGFGL